MTTDVELYEALKPTLGEEVARMIAERLPPSERIVTKLDFEHGLAALKADLDSGLAAVRADLEHRTELIISRVDGRISVSESRMFRWMLGFFATLWVAQSAMIVAIVTKL